MSRSLSLCRWMLCCLVAAASMSTASGTVTLESMLKEITSRESLARLPQPAYTCSQASSYDRTSKTPDDHNAWFANADRSQWVRIEERTVDGQTRKEYVMMDQAGPGAIVRFWGTWHGPRGEPFSNGTLRIYLDGSDTPVIEGPIQEVLDQGLLAEGPLSQGVSPETPYGQRGHNLYLPIPYAKHCKVTYSTDVPMDIGARTGEAVYYQINYRTYEEGTEVETFSMERLQQAESAINQTQKQLAEGVEHDGETVAEATHQGSIAAGDSATIELQGPKAIRLLSLKLDADDLPQALRSVVLKIDFDGQPAVWVPVGDFFGIGYEPRQYRTFYTEVTPDGQMIAKWVMPFEQSAQISLVNLGDQPVEATCDVVHADWLWDDRSMHFHAAWHELYKVDTRRGSEKAGDGAYDVNYVTIDGTGVYVGDTLTVFNGAAAWWGEGDEKIYVDDEKFPSHFGTGTEDYYGYAWCRPEKFSAPFHAQPCGEGNLAGGFTVNSRYRALDAIPFDQSLKFDMELWHWADTKVNYAPTVFYYARPGATDNVDPAPDAASREVTTSREQMGTIYVAEGVIEGEDLKWSASGGTVEIQTHGGWGWSNEKQLWWRDAEVGDELEVKVPVAETGLYLVTMQATEAPDYAKVELSLSNGDTEVVDMYGPKVASVRPWSDLRRLTKGTHPLKIRIVGHNEKAEPRGMFGLDYLKLTPVTEAK